MKKINYNSIKNQEIKSKFIEREVIKCFSQAMQVLLEKEIISYDDIENLYNYACPECGYSHADLNKFTNYYKSKEALKCPYCNKILETEPESEPVDIFEWWIVTEYLYNKLKEKGECVLEWEDCYIWGRTTTGQAIHLDGVISEICKEMEILEG